MNRWGRDVEQGVTLEDLADSKLGQEIDSFFLPPFAVSSFGRDSIVITESP
jgi:hypothetical protein